MRIAVIADTHIAPSETPGYVSNGLLADRSRFVVAEINRLSPDVVVHLGDVVHPLPSDPGHRAAVALAASILSRLEAPLHVVPGNHDVGDKPRSLVAVPPVSDEAYDVFERTWGPAFHSVDMGGLHFVFVDTPVLNSGLARETEQAAWLAADLEQAAGRRIFLFGHYPPFLRDPAEPEHYDNLADPGRSWLLGLLETHGVEAAFFGHVHHGFSNRYATTDLSVTPATGFTRPDYTELAHIEAADEFGRDDRAKLGFLVVDVDADGHRVTTVRTYGSTGAPLPVPAHVAVDAERISPIGVTLRHAWNATVPMPTDGLDEFRRKTVRNDDVFLALLEARVPDILIPIADLFDDPDRVAALVRLGVGVGVVTTEPPTPDLWETVTRTGVTRIVVVLPSDEIGTTPLRTGHAPEGVIVAASPIVAFRPGEHHFVSHGFDLEDPSFEDLTGVDEVVFRCPPDASPWDTIRAGAGKAHDHGLRSVVNVQTPRGVETAVFNDDTAVARHVAEATVAAMSHPHVTVYLDTFVDHDRGYYPRHGLLDRRYDPRPAFRVLCNLTGRIPAGRWEPEAPGRFVHEHGAVLILAADGTSWDDAIDLTTGRAASTGTEGPILVAP